jgi:hypothetical protein
MSYQLKRNDKAAALQALKEGQYEAITTSGEGALDRLVHLAIEMGVFEALEVIKISRERQGIPDELLLRTLAVLPFVEAMGLSAAAGRLFQDAAILLRLGYTLEQLQEGFNQRHHRDEAKAQESRPCHVEVLRQELERIDLASLDSFRKQCVKRFFQKKLVRGKLCAIDGTSLRDRYRVVGLLNVHKDRALWLSWRIIDGKASEKGKEASVVRSLVEEVREIGGEDAIEWLLMDALYADGPLLAWLEYGLGIHALVRLPQDRLLYEDLLGLAEGGLIPWETHTDMRYVAGHKQVRQVSLAMARELTSWDSFCEAGRSYGIEEPSLWGCLIRSTDVEDPTATEEWGLVSTYPFPSGWAGYCQWRNRWRIENTGFRELKEGWHLEAAPWSYTQDVVVAARVAFTLIAFNVSQIARTWQGRQMTARGIRKLRGEMAKEYGQAPVIVFTKDAYGIFHIEEVMAALGVPPAASLRRGGTLRGAT